MVTVEIEALVINRKVTGENISEPWAHMVTKSLPNTASNGRSSHT